MRIGSTPSLGLTLTMLLTGCPGDDSSAGTETEGASSSGTTSDPSTTSGPSSATGSTGEASTGPAETEGLDSTSTGGEESSSGDPPSDGVCIGIDQVGFVGSVYSLDGAPIDTTCAPDPAPCGGDLVGTWNIESNCGFEDFPNPLEGKCAGSVFTLEVVGQSGSITFAGDGTYTEDVDVQVQAVIELDPMMCFGVDCATFEGILQADDPGASCTSMMGTCTCTFPPEPAGGPTMGTYVVMGDSVVLDDGTDVTELQYCVMGDRLDAWEELYNFTDTGVLCGDEQDCMDALGDAHQFYVCGDPTE